MDGSIDKASIILWDVSDVSDVFNTSFFHTQE